MSDSTAEYGIAEFTADNIKVGPGALLATCQELLERANPPLTNTEVSEALGSIGLGSSVAVQEELSEETRFTSDEKFSPEDMVIELGSQALSLLALAKKLTFREAHLYVEGRIKGEPEKHRFKEKLLNNESHHELEQGHNKAALKLARKATAHAKKSGDKNTIVEAQYHEAFVLFQSEHYELAAPKLEKLWKKVKDGDDLLLAEDDEFKARILQMWQESHFYQANLEKMCLIQSEMYEAGYAKETVDEYRERVLREVRREIF